MTLHDHPLTVTTQSELDRALADGVKYIDIKSPAGVWLQLTASDSAAVWASGTATVRASGSATVWAYDSATVWAYDSATVRAGSHVAVHLHDAQAKIDGGVVIDHTAVDTECQP